jgi:hypothetical protein
LRLKFFDNDAYAIGSCSTVLNGVVNTGFSRILLSGSPETALDIQLSDPQQIALGAIYESDPRARIRRLGTTTGPATVAYGVRDVTTVAGRDYKPVLETVSFAPFEVEKEITIPLIDNSTFDGSRTFELFLTNAVGAQFLAPALPVTIIDDEFGFLGNPVKNADGSTSLKIQVPVLVPFRVQASHNLEDWSDLEEGYSSWSPTGPVTFLDSLTSTWPKRFYRIIRIDPVRTGGS